MLKLFLEIKYLIPSYDIFFSRLLYFLFFMELIKIIIPYLLLIDSVQLSKNIKQEN